MFLFSYTLQCGTTFDNYLFAITFLYDKYSNLESAYGSAVKKHFCHSESALILFDSEFPGPVCTATKPFDDIFMCLNSAECVLFYLPTRTEKQKQLRFRKDLLLGTDRIPSK